MTVHIGGDASGTTFDHYSGTYYRALVIRNYTADTPPDWAGSCALTTGINIFNAARANNAMQNLNNEDLIILSIMNYLVKSC